MGQRKRGCHRLITRGKEEGGTRVSLTQHTSFFSLYLVKSLDASRQRANFSWEKRKKGGR